MGSLQAKTAQLKRDVRRLLGLDAPSEHASDTPRRSSPGRTPSSTVAWEPDGEAEREPTLRETAQAVEVLVDGWLMEATAGVFDAYNQLTSCEERSYMELVAAKQHEAALMNVEKWARKHQAAVNKYEEQLALLKSQA